jgi:hypothetical protein
MQSLRDFNCLMLQNKETKNLWEGLKQAAFDFCKINCKIVMARNLKRPYPDSWNIDRELKSKDFLNAFAQMATACENLGIEVPEFGAPEICRLAS